MTRKTYPVNPRSRISLQNRRRANWTGRMRHRFETKREHRIPLAFWRKFTRQRPRICELSTHYSQFPGWTRLSALNTLRRKDKNIVEQISVLLKFPLVLYCFHQDRKRETVGTKEIILDCSGDKEILMDFNRFEIGIDEIFHDTILLYHTMNKIFRDIQFIWRRRRNISRRNIGYMIQWTKYSVQCNLYETIDEIFRDII